MGKLCSRLSRVVLFSCVLALAGCVGPTRTYRVAVLSVPPKLDPVNLVTLSTLLIYSNLYFPLFSHDEYGSLQSQFLDMKRTGAVSTKFDEFRFCLKDKLFFSDGSPVQVSDLALMLKRLPQAKWNIPSMTVQPENESRCVRVGIGRPDRNLFEKFLTIRSTLLKETTIDSRHPIGLGPYRLSAHEENRITLEANPGAVVGDFKRVEFVLVNTSDFSTVTEPIDDWNNISATIPESLLGNRFNKVERLLPKINYLQIGINDPVLRRLVAQCIDHEDFIQTLQLPLKPLGGIIPSGVLGSELELTVPLKRKLSSQCLGKSPKATVPYYSFNPALHDRVVKYFERHNPQLPVTIVVEKHSITETNEAQANHKNFLTLYGMTADEPLPEAFFEDFIRPSWTYPPIGKLEKHLRASLVEESLGKRMSLLATAHTEVLESGYVIPLGQVKAVLHYPKEIRNIRSVYSFDIFTRIDQLRLSRWPTSWGE